MMSYVNLEIVTPDTQTQTQLKSEEFIKYVSDEVIEKFRKAENLNDVQTAKEQFSMNIKDNFNCNSPQGNFGCYCKILDDNAKKDYQFFDLNTDRLTIAEYCLNNYKEPIKSLENISAKLYEYKSIFDNRVLYLVNEDSIKNAKQMIVDFNRSITDYQRHDLILDEQNKKR